MYIVYDIYGRIEFTENNEMPIARLNLRLEECIIKYSKSKVA